MSGAADRVEAALAARGYPPAAAPLTDQEWAAYASGVYTQPLRHIPADLAAMILSGWTLGLCPPSRGVDDLYAPSEEELAEILSREPV